MNTANHQHRRSASWRLVHGHSPPPASPVSQLETGPWPQSTTKDSCFWWMYYATVGSVSDQPQPGVQLLTEDGRRCLPELLDFAGDQASFCGFTEISINSDLQGSFRFSDFSVYHHHHLTSSPVPSVPSSFSELLMQFFVIFCMF